MSNATSAYLGYRFPPAIISHCVGLYFRFSVSYRDFEIMIAERCVVVADEWIWAWCDKFGQDDAKRVRVRRGKLGDTWHLVAVYLKIVNTMHHGVQVCNVFKVAGRNFRLRRIKASFPRALKPCACADPRTRNDTPSIHSNLLTLTV